MAAHREWAARAGAAQQPERTRSRSEVLDYWKTIDDDYHWHIEILPILDKKSKSYTFKEVYFTPVTSETAARRLREASPGK